MGERVPDIDSHQGGPLRVYFLAGFLEDPAFTSIVSLLDPKQPFWDVPLDGAARLLLIARHADKKKGLQH